MARRPAPQLQLEPSRLSPSRALAALALLASIALASACASRPPPRPVPAVNRAPGPAPAPGAVEMSGLTDSARVELQAVLTDEFCPCGCPHSLDSCLKEHPRCRHAQRAAQLAGSFARDGVAGVEIINALSRYYRSFGAQRHAFPVDARMCKGASDARVTLVEFSDFECPFCASVRPLFEAFVARHGQMVKFCYATYPLANHPGGLLAAQAALSAREHGKFWPMHDLLFDHQLELNRQAIRRLYESLGLPGAELEQAWAEGRFLEEINGMKDAAKAAGVTGTPALFVNGREYRLGLSEDVLVHTVDDELEWIAGQGAWVPD